MDFNEIAAIAGASGFTLLGTLYGWMKIWFKQKEQLSLQNRDIELLNSEFDRIRQEVEKLETELYRKNNQLSDKLNKLELKMEQNKNEIILHIDNIKK